MEPCPKYSCTGEAVRALPTLPPEVILSIIRHSLSPPTSYAAVASRYPVLLIYSHVCRAWHELAQAELFAHVLLKDVVSAQLFVAACSSDRHGALGRMTVTLRLGQHGVTVNSKEKNVALCEPITVGLVPRVREAWITGLRQMSLSFFYESTELDSLRLYRVNIIEPIDRTQRYLIPNLRHLSLHFCGLTIVDDQDVSLSHDTRIASFVAESLPPLESFFSHNSFVNKSGWWHQALDFSSCGPAECHTLTLDGRWTDRESGAYWALRLPAYTKLARLGIALFKQGDTALDDLVAVLAAVPTELETLHLPYLRGERFFPKVMENVLQVLDRDLPCLRKLRRLILCTVTDNGDAVDVDSRSLKHGVEIRCAELGIDLIQRESVRDAWMDGWEEYDENWGRDSRGEGK